MAFKVPPVTATVKPDDLPERHRDEFPVPERRDRPVSVDLRDEHVIVEGVIPCRTQVHAAKCCGHLSGGHEGLVEACPGDQIDAFLSFEVLTFRVIDRELRRFAEQQIRGHLAQVRGDRDMQFHDPGVTV